MNKSLVILGKVYLDFIIYLVTEKLINQHKYK